MEIYKREIQAYRLREAVRPGMTGWRRSTALQLARGAQTALRSGLYQQHDLLLDLKILFNTLWVAVGIRPRERPQETADPLFITLICFLLPFFLYTCLTWDLEAPTLEPSAPLKQPGAEWKTPHK